MKDDVATLRAAAPPAWSAAKGLRGLATPSARVMDRLEQGVLLVFFALLCWRLLPGSLQAHQWNGLMILVSESTILFFVLIRRPTDRITASPVDWVVALGGAVAPLLVESGSATFLPGLGLALMMAGWVIHTGAKLSLRRSFGIVPANRGVKTTGLYGLVRHPMYLGYLVTHVGFFLSAPSIWNYLVYVVAWACFAIRIRAEERVLSMSAEYQAYRAKVRYRLIPGLW